MDQLRVWGIFVVGNLVGEVKAPNGQQAMSLARERFPQYDNERCGLSVRSRGTHETFLHPLLTDTSDHSVSG